MKSASRSVIVAVLVTACTGAAGPTTTVLTLTTTAAPTTSITDAPATTTTPPTTATTPTTTTPTTTTPLPLAGRVIVIDPGHNGMNWAYPEEINRLVDIGNGTKPCNTTGTSSNDGFPEHEFTWATALLARDRLEELGATVVLTRDDNEGWGPCITVRAATGNQVGADAVISIHADGAGPEDSGFHVIYPAIIPGLTDDIAAESYRLAQALHAAVRATGMPVANYIPDGYSRRSDLGGLNLSDVPVVFLESGNMRNAEDIVLIEDPIFHQAVADAIGAALIEFLSG